MAVTLLARRPLRGSSCAANVSCKPTLAMAAVPKAAPWRLALREALLLCMFRRQLWNAPATSRACRAASPPIASRSFWICQTSSAVGAVRMRSRIGFKPAMMDSLMGWDIGLDSTHLPDDRQRRGGGHVRRAQNGYCALRSPATDSIPMSALRAFCPLLLMLGLVATLRPLQGSEAPRAGIAERDGQHDFDFEIGTWKTHLSRRLHPLTGSNTWVEMDGTTVVRKVWPGKANLV